MFILFLFKIVRKQARKIHCTKVPEVQMSMFLQQLSLCFTCPVAVLYLNSGLADSILDFCSNFLIQIEQAVISSLHIVPRTKSSKLNLCLSFLEDLGLVSIRKLKNIVKTRNQVSLQASKVKSHVQCKTRNWFFKGQRNFRKDVTIYLAQLVSCWL